MSDRPFRTRYFTPEEADALLPRVARSLAQAREHAEQFEGLVHALKNGMIEESEHDDAVGHAEQLRVDVARVIEELQELGIEVKGLRQGLVDFPALRNGQEVYLCWKQGEPRVRYWHPMHTGFTGRRSIDDDLPGTWEWCN